MGSGELLGLQGQGDALLPMAFHQGHSIPQISPGCFGHRFLTDTQRMESISLCSAWRRECEPRWHHTEQARQCHH